MTEYIRPSSPHSVPSSTMFENTSSLVLTPKRYFVGQRGMTDALRKFPAIQMRLAAQRLLCGQCVPQSSPRDIQQPAGFCRVHLTLVHHDGYFYMPVCLL